MAALTCRIRLCGRRRAQPVAWTLKRNPRVTCRDCGTRLFIDVLALRLLGSMVTSFVSSRNSPCSASSRFDPVENSLPASGRGQHGLEVLTKRSIGKFISASVLMASGLIGPSGLTLGLHVSPLRQPSASRSNSTKATSMMMPGALQAKVACGQTRRLVYACQSSPRRRRRAGRNRRGNSAGTSRRSEAAPIRTRFANRRHGVRPNDSQVSKTGRRADRAMPRISAEPAGQL